MFRSLLTIGGFFFLATVSLAQPRFTFEKADLANPVNFYNPAGDVRLGNVIWDGQSIRPLDFERANENGDGFIMNYVGSQLGPCFQTGAHVNGTNYIVSRFGGCSSFAYDLNSQGDIVGATDDSPEDTYAGRHPYLFKNGTLYWLNNLVDGPLRFDYPVKISDAGVIYGVRGTYNDYAVVRLNPRPDGRFDATELARTPIANVKISKAGGFVYQDRYWNGHEFVAIGDFVAPERVYPVAINSAGQILGYATEPNARYNLFFWEGQIFELKDLVYLPANWTMGEPFDLNEYGQILIYAFYPNENSGYERLVLRLTPDPAIRSLSTAGGQVTIRFSPGRRRPISVQTSTDFHSWTDLQSIQTPSPQETATITSSSEHRFFRMVRSP